MITAQKHIAGKLRITYSSPAQKLYAGNPNITTKITRVQCPPKIDLPKSSALANKVKYNGYNNTCHISNYKLTCPKA